MQLTAWTASTASAATAADNSVTLLIPNLDPRINFSWLAAGEKSSGGNAPPSGYSGAKIKAIFFAAIGPLPPPA